MKFLILLGLLLTSVANAGTVSNPVTPPQFGTIYKCLDSPKQNIVYMNEKTSQCYIHILSFPAGTKEPTRKDRYFPYICWANMSHGLEYDSDSSRGQRCIQAPALVTDKVFAPTSFWYTPLPANAPVAANNAALVADFLAQKKKYYGTVAINISQYSSPVYTVPQGITTVKVGFFDCQRKGFLDKGFDTMLSNVPIPVYAKPAGGTDAEMSIYQPSTDSLWEMWRASKDPTTGKWTACWGGKLENASKSQGVMPTYYGTTATSLPFIGGQITAEELQRKEIKHAIGIAMVDLYKFTSFSWPAQRSDGNGKGLIMQGQRFRLDPTVDVSKLNMPEAGKTIARAAQKYGFVVWDTAGGISIRAQAPISYTVLGKPDPYPALWGGPSWAVLNNFPWDKLQFMPVNYGKPTQ